MKPSWDMGELVRLALDEARPLRERRPAVAMLAGGWRPEDKIAAQSALRALVRHPALGPEARQALASSLDSGTPFPPRWGKPPRGRRGRTHREFLQRAIELAVENVQSGRGGPFGAVIVRGGRVMAEGTNLVTAINDPSAHAEVMAIRAACGRAKAIHLDGCAIYSSCEPCPMCLGAIHWARLDALYFAATREDAAAAGFDDSFIYDQVPLAPGTRSIPARRMLARTGREPLALWMADRDRVAY